MDLATWIDSLPKSELHVHLEGSIPLWALFEILTRHGGDPEVPDLQALERRFAYRDFPHFLAMWTWKHGFLRDAEDFAFLAEAAAREWLAQNITYVEAHYSPTDASQTGLSVGELTRAVRRGLDRVVGVEVRLICDVVRDSPIPRALRTAEEAAELQDLGVVGIGLGGPEHSHPPEPFAPVFARARALGLHTTAHAGEAAGPESVRGAVEVLQAGRIGHATRAIEDPGLVELLAREQTPLELCPISNLRTGAVPSLESHPVRTYFERGLKVTLNTDDPPMFNTTLTGEFVALHEVHGFTREDLLTLLHNALDASWMRDSDKTRRHLELDQAARA
jgi:adenosine deaminase